MRTDDVIIFLQEYMTSVFDDGSIRLDMFYKIETQQHVGKLKINYGDFAVTYDVCLNDYYIQKEIVDFCNDVVGSVKHEYAEYLRKEK